MTDSPTYNVVMKTLVGLSEGVMTRTSFKNQNEFEQWHQGNMRDGTNRPLRDVYEIIAHGVSDSEAARIISSPHNTDAIVTSLRREANFYLSKAIQSLDALDNG